LLLHAILVSIPGALLGIVCAIKGNDYMAERVNVVLVDDIDGSDASEKVTFGLDGVQYEIDLSQEHADELRAALALYIGHGRRAGGRKRATGNGRAATGASSNNRSGGPSAAEIRAWARENGWDVPERGRVSAEVREAYAAAN
jgi:hypothetical protein